MVVGIVAGTYSSIYVAAPLTEWIDTRMARQQKKKRVVPGSGARKAVVKA
jgi:preprotein translocase subunit SecF